MKRSYPMARVKKSLSPSARLLKPSGSLDHGVKRAFSSQACKAQTLKGSAHEGRSTHQLMVLLHCLLGRGGYGKVYTLGLLFCTAPAALSPSGFHGAPISGKEVCKHKAAVARCMRLGCSSVQHHQDGIRRSGAFVALPIKQRKTDRF
jgi:hypothetical protein